MRPLFIAIAIVFGISGTTHAAVHFMGMDGSSRGTLDVADDGANKGKVVVDVNGKETLLGSGGGSCGILCAVLTAKIENGKAQILPIVPDVYVGDAATRFKTVFSETINAKEYELAMATPELATAAVGKMLGIVSADGATAKIGLTDTKDARTDVLVADMAQAKNDIATLKAQLAKVQAALEVQVKDAGSCRSVTTVVPILKTIVTGDWVVMSSAAVYPIQI